MSDDCHCYRCWWETTDEPLFRPRMFLCDLCGNNGVTPHEEEGG